MCRRKVKKSPFVVKERSEDIIPYSIPIISKGESNRDDPLGQFVSSLYGKDVKDEAILIRKDTKNIDSIRNINQETDDIPAGFKTIKRKVQEEEIKDNVDTRKSAIDLLNELDKSIKEEVYVEPSINEFHTYNEPIIDTPTVEPLKQTEYVREVKEEPVINEYTYQREFKTEYVKKVEEGQLSLDEISILNSGHKHPIEYDNYVAPSIELLNDPQSVVFDDASWVKEKADIIDRTFKDFKIGGHVEESTVGPTFTRFAVKLDPGVSGNKVDSLENDIQRELAVPSIRIENPIPGKAFIGIEVPNIRRKYVSLKEVLNRQEFKERRKALLVPTGLNVDGEVKFMSIENPPHGIIAGQSGSGKSVFINTLILSLIYQYSPKELRFLFVDPKQVDIAPYAPIPHLMAPVVEKYKDALKIFKFLIEEMDRRYALLKLAKVSKIEEYQQKTKGNDEYPLMPYVVLVVDEAGSILEQGGKELESLIVELTNKSRAAGIHVFLSMQKPIAKTLSTRIKSNMALRFAFSVTNYSDSSLILEAGGAEKLLQYGDMLFSDGGQCSRYQAANVSQEEVLRVVNYLSRYKQDFYFDPLKDDEEEIAITKSSNNNDCTKDSRFKEACRYVVRNGSCSSNSIMHEFNLSWYNANDFIQKMEEFGIVEKFCGKKARQILVDMDTLEMILERI